MDNNKNKGLKPFFFGLLALTVFNCSAVKTGDLSQTPNTVEISPTVQKSVSSGQASGVLRLTVADVRTEHLNALQGHFAIASVEVRAGKAHDEESRKSRETENSQENDSNPWISVSNYDAKGKSYEITPGDAATYPVDMYLLPSGDYRNIRIKLVDGQSQVLALDGTSSTWHNVKTPSAGESGLKLRGSFTVEDNMMTTVSFNLELEKTREEHKDNAKNDKKQKEHRDSSNNADYLIKPEIRFASATTGNLPAVDSVAFSPAAGAYNANQSVAMTSTTIGASVCYTADGTIPACDALASCTAGNAYTGAVSVASSQTLTAIACKTGYSASAPVSSAYAIDKPPTVPASFVAKNVSSSQIDLSWSSSTDDLTASSALTYEICQSTVSGACLKFSPVYVTVPGVIAYSATGLAPATTYFFSVRAKDQSGNASAASAEISASTSAVSAWAVQYPVPNLLTGVTDNGLEKMVTGNNGLLISSQDGINWFSEFVLSGSNINSVTNTSRGE
ncbi:MAG: chitobiase/beta-hexosaminidase C-terminal domain-containing protein, partial [Spirochaetia bacterium]|nr:chitobiase/beta-hexosaminidase C-terminal domain-containing protein [Spirochaetia bacterium]